ncbi:MoxR family ATPase [soil metagenome]
MSERISDGILTGFDFHTDVDVRANFDVRVKEVLNNIGAVIDGKPHAARIILTSLLAEGHVLIEDVPGVGKTVLAKALATSINGTVRRIQFTADLLPSDITGVSVYNPTTSEFEFKHGAVFANVVIGDEINRASPKTQSALLEAMDERQVTVDGRTHQLPRPFTVIATQNPLDMEGTFALPEAQLDRFMVKISLGYPDTAAELEMLRDRNSSNPLDQISAVVTADDVRTMIDVARSTHVSPEIEDYCVRIVQATRTDPGFRLGASPRATLQLVRAAKAYASISGRDFVLPDDVRELVVPVLAHRLIVARHAREAHGTRDAAGSLLEAILTRLAAPTGL